jgi:hypothetical protein
MEYTKFETYPLNISGINESYNEELTAIEGVVSNAISYSGDVADLVNILPYFVFYAFCEDKGSDVTTKGESITSALLTVPSLQKQIKAWNLGAELLRLKCIEKTATANKNYQSQNTSL